jgi:uncharacterized protein YyaL (SSP411 family)
MFMELMEKLSSLWSSDRERCLSSAKDIAEQLRSSTVAGVAGIEWQDLPHLTLVQKAINTQLVSYDARDGGFGSAPKFPSPPNTFHLLHRYSAETTSSDGMLSPLLSEAGFKGDLGRKALEASAFTLARIARGGITDALGGGIARYSVDSEWKVPHFEKMLYDQGQLLSCFSEAVQLCVHSDSPTLQAYIPEFKSAIQGIMEYLSRDLTSLHGAFYAAEDADSLASVNDTHGKEGAFYIWDAREIEELLGKNSNAHRLVTLHYDIKLDGNITPQSDPHGEMTGMNMLHSTKPLHGTAQQLGLSEIEGRTILEESRIKMFARRNERPRPIRDDKIITSWNFLAISGLAQASKVLKDAEGGTRAVEMAERCAEFMWSTMWDSANSQFLRSFREDTKGPLGFDVDYAFAVQGLLDLYEVTFKKAYLERALDVQRSQDRLFWESAGPGGYLISQEEGDGNILGRQKADQDGAEPTSTSVSAHNWLRLRAMLSNLDTRVGLDSRTRVAQCIMSNAMILTRVPQALGTRLTALLQAKLGPIQIILVGQRQAKETRALLEYMHSRFIPRASLIYIDTTGGVEDARDKLGDTLIQGNEAVRQMLEDPKILEKASHVTICQDFTCALPIYTVEELKQQLP